MHELVTIQKTAKRYKGAIMTAWAMMLGGMAIVAAGAPAGATLCALSVPLWVGAKALAWWNHG